MIGSSPVTLVSGSWERVLELNVHPSPELLQVDTVPIGADFVADPAGLLCGRPSLFAHFDLLC